MIFFSSLKKIIFAKSFNPSFAKIKVHTKYKVYNFIFPFSLVLNFSLLAMAQEVCKTDIAISNANFRPTPENSNDLMTIRLANFLKANDLSLSCVDLRSLKSSTTYDARNKSLSITKEDVGLISNVKFTQSQIKNLTEAICKDAGPSCKIEVNAKCVANEALTFSHDILEGLPGASKDGITLSDMPTAAVGTIDKFPRFSQSCDTGLHTDSWNKAASTSAARQLLEKSGLNYNSIRTIELKLNNERFWSFGFIDHNQAPPLKNPDPNLPIDPSKSVDI